MYDNLISRDKPSKAAKWQNSPLIIFIIVHRRMFAANLFFGAPEGDDLITNCHDK